MIRISNNEDILALSQLLFAMYSELQPEYVSLDGSVYISEIVRCMNDPKQTIFLDDDLRGFFIVVDETEPMTPTLEVYNGTRVFIKPEYRNGRVLKEFYDTLFSHFPTGDILGVTLVHSEHIKVLEKRHTRIANLYKLKRS